MFCVECHLCVFVSVSCLHQLSPCCYLGAAEDATAVFGEAAALCIQKQYLHCSTSSKLHSSAEDCNIVDTRHSASEDTSPRQLKLMQSMKDIPGNHHGPSILGGTAQPINSGLSNISFYNTPSPMAAQVIASDFISCTH